MRSPASEFDLRAALVKEVQAASADLSAADERPKAIHRCRVRLKRARALARVGSAGAPGLASLFNDTARSVMRNLAPARDLSALAEAARVVATQSSAKESRALEFVAGQLSALAAGAPATDAEALRSSLRDLLALANVWPEASPNQIRKGAMRIARRARRARKRGLGAGCANRRHDWRKREKDRFFAALILGGAWPGKRRRRIAEHLGDVLGQERDVLLLIDRLQLNPVLAGDAKTLRRALRALETRRAGLAARADRIGARLHAGGV